MNLVLLALTVVAGVAYNADDDGLPGLIATVLAVGLMYLMLREETIDHDRGP